MDTRRYFVKGVAAGQRWKSKNASRQNYIVGVSWITETDNVVTNQFPKMNGPGYYDIDYFLRYFELIEDVSIRPYIDPCGVVRNQIFVWEQNAKGKWVRRTVAQFKPSESSKLFYSHYWDMVYDYVGASGNRENINPDFLPWFDTILIGYERTWKQFSDDVAKATRQYEEYQNSLGPDQIYATLNPE